MCADNSINVMPSFKDHQGRKLNRASLSFHSCVKKLCLSLQPCSTPCGSSFLHLSTWWFIFPESRMALLTRLEGLWGFILHLNILNAEARGDSTSCSLVQRKGNKVLEPVSEWQCRSARGSQSLLLALWNTSLGAGALLALYKAGSWLWKLQRNREQLGRGRQNLHFLKPLAVVVPFSFTQHMLNRYNSKCSCATADWMSWFRWNENRCVNSRLLLVWCF